MHQGLASSKLLGCLLAMLCRKQGQPLRSRQGPGLLRSAMQNSHLIPVKSHANLVRAQCVMDTLAADAVGHAYAHPGNELDSAN
jgi:hypothetical protein